MNFTQNLQELFSQHDMCLYHKYKDIFNVVKPIIISKLIIFIDSLKKTKCGRKRTE